MSGKVVQLLLLPEFEKQMTKEDVEKYFRALFAQNSKLKKVVDLLVESNMELGETVFNMKKRLDNISINYLEKTP